MLQLQIDLLIDIRAHTALLIIFVFTLDGTEFLLFIICLRLLTIFWSYWRFESKIQIEWNRLNCNAKLYGLKNVIWNCLRRPNTTMWVLLTVCACVIYWMRPCHELPGKSSLRKLQAIMQMTSLTMIFLLLLFSLVLLVVDVCKRTVFICTLSLSIALIDSISKVCIRIRIRRMRV